jgi:membrane protein
MARETVRSARAKTGSKRLQRRLPLALAPWIALGVMLAVWPRRGAVDEAAPGERPPAGLKDVLWRTWKTFHTDNIVSVAGSVSFFALLAIFPGTAAFVSLFGMIGDVGQAQKQLTTLTGVLPADALAFIGGEMTRIAAQRHASLSLTFVIALLLSIWSANAGMKALIGGLNVAYEAREKRSFIGLNLVSLAFTLGGLAAMIVTILALLALPVLLALAGLDPDASLWGPLRWPIMLLLGIGGLTLLYRYGPSREPARWRWINAGAAAAAAAWLGVSVLFSWYVGNIAAFSVTYGSLSAAIGFMIWIWLSVIVILAGAELNDELERLTTIEPATAPPLPEGD